MAESNPERRDREEIKKEREREREERRHLRQLEFNDSGELSRDFIEAMCDTSALRENTVTLLQEYLSRQWILANLSDAEHHDIKHKLKVTKFKIFGLHPPSESVVQGPVRAFLMDDADENLRSLSPKERVEIEGLVDSVAYALSSRGRGGFEREALNTAVRESRTRRDDRENDSSGRFGGLFS